MISIKKAMMGGKKKQSASADAESVSDHSNTTNHDSVRSGNSSNSRKTTKNKKSLSPSSYGGATKEEIDFFLNMDKDLLLEKLGQVAIEDDHVATAAKSNSNNRRKKSSSSRSPTRMGRETTANALLRHLEEEGR